jgi:hypothetical protein
LNLFAKDVNKALSAEQTKRNKAFFADHAGENKPLKSTETPFHVYTKYGKA